MNTPGPSDQDGAAVARRGNIFSCVSFLVEERRAGRASDFPTWWWEGLQGVNECVMWAADLASGPGTQPSPEWTLADVLDN